MPTPSSLTRLIAAAAVTAVDLQRRLDAAHAADTAAFEALLAAVPEQARGLVLPLAPVALRVATHAHTFDLQVQAERTSGFALRAVPVGLGYERIHGGARRSALRLSVQIVRTPLSTNPEQPTSRGGRP